MKTIQGHITLNRQLYEQTRSREQALVRHLERLRTDPEYAAAWEREMACEWERQYREFGTDDE